MPSEMKSSGSRCSEHEEGGPASPCSLSRAAPSRTPDRAAPAGLTERQQKGSVGALQPASVEALYCSLPTSALEGIAKRDSAA